MAETVACRACGSHGLVDLGPCAPFPAELAMPLDDGTTVAPGRLLRCQDCGLGQRVPCLQPQALAEIYRRTPPDAMDYDYDDNCAWSEARRCLLARFDHSQERVVLDIGCHTGAFLAGLPANWQRLGIEGAEAPRQIASGQHAVRIIADTLETVSTEWNGRFDAVALFDVVEHLPNPAEGLGRAASLLKPGGLLLISTADMDAWTWRLAAGRHWYLQTPLHLSVASMPFFRFVARRHGLSILSSKKIAHRRADARTRWRDRYEAIYWECHQRGGLLRLPQRLMHSLPGMQRLRHKQAAPWAMSLQDHVFVVMAAGQAAR